MGQLAAYCCRDDHEEVNEQVDIYNQNNYGNTYPCIKQELKNSKELFNSSFEETKVSSKQEPIFQTRPPCWFGHKCDCDCHQGGVCLFKRRGDYHNPCGYGWR